MSTEIKTHLFRPDGSDKTMCGRTLKHFSTIWPLDVVCKSCLASYLAMGEENYHETFAQVNPFHWVNIHFAEVAEMIPIATCPGHVNGVPCVGPYAHLWNREVLKAGRRLTVSVMTLCLPKLGNA